MRQQLGSAVDMKNLMDEMDQNIIATFVIVYFPFFKYKSLVFITFVVLNGLTIFFCTYNDTSGRFQL